MNCSCPNCRAKNRDKEQCEYCYNSHLKWEHCLFGKRRKWPARRWEYRTDYLSYASVPRDCWKHPEGHREHSYLIALKDGLNIEHGVLATIQSDTT